mgnify:CR=1 FL=1
MSENSYKEISKFYDVMHSDKDYSHEADCIKAYVDRYSNFLKVRSILDFGCGTCSHLSFLIDKKEAVGIDICPEMISKASVKNIKNLELYNCNIRDFKTNRTFELCISMFNIFNHFDSLSELGLAFERISSLLEPGSLFIFDSLNAVAALRDPPRDRQLEKSIDGKKYLYNSRCSHDLMNSQFTMFNEISFDGLVQEHKLVQTLWAPKLFSDLLSSNNFKLLNIYKSFTLKEANASDYKICFVARKR